MLIVGTGCSGLGVAVQLQEAGISDFLMITKHDGFGGVWHQNRYPGCGVDLNIANYQFSFAFKSDWSRAFALQPELEAYFRVVAAEHGLYEKAHFEAELLEAEWLEDELCWSVSTTRGTYLADFLVLATGFLEDPTLPNIPGIGAFKGRIFHASEWPDEYTGEGDRIAVIGTGASAFQIVPAMQKIAGAVTVFQRSPTYIFPKQDRVFSEEERAGFRESPGKLSQLRDELFDEEDATWLHVALGRAESAEEAQLGEELRLKALSFLAEEVPDPDLRKLLTPDDPVGCKRPGLSDDYYAALTQDNVELIAEAAAAITPTSVMAVGGREVEVDTVVLATGFNFGGDILDLIRRRDRRTAAAVQHGSPRAYKSISVAGCPNMFCVGGAGANGALWNGIYCGEIVSRYIIATLHYMEANGIRALEVDEAAEIDWKRYADDFLANSPTVNGGCANHYLDENGRNKALYPGNTAKMKADLRDFDPAGYNVVARHEDSCQAPAFEQGPRVQLIAGAAQGVQQGDATGTRQTGRDAKNNDPTCPPPACTRNR